MSNVPTQSLAWPGHFGTTRDLLLDYADREEFSDTIAAAKERCHQFAEEQLYGRASAGASFSLKNNWGWKDRQEIDHSGQVKWALRFRRPASRGPQCPRSN